MVAELCLPPARAGHAEEGDAGDRKVSFPRWEDSHPSARFSFCRPRTMVGQGLKCPAKLSVLAPWGTVGVAFCYCPRGWSGSTQILPMGAF